MRALVLVDGEHYPPVTLAAIDAVRAKGHEVVAAVLLGGGEKLDGTLSLGELAVVGPGERRTLALREAITRFQPKVVVDLSDAPVVSTSDRLLFASIALAMGVVYEGEGFRFEPPDRPRLAERASIGVIGSGKRTGKTAICAALARYARTQDRRPLIVAMGRGGPSEPVVTRQPPSVDDLLGKAEAGEHASTDAYEDAITAGCTTIGARRGGSGFAGQPMHHTVFEAVRAANAEPHDLLLLEGSGTAIPPVHADRTLFVLGGSLPWIELQHGFGAYRVAISDAIVVTAPAPDDDPTLSAMLRWIDAELGAQPPVVRATLHPKPLTDVRGQRIVVATTAPASAQRAIRATFEDEHGANVVEVTNTLADRTRLREALERVRGRYDTLVTEIKAAGIDVAARTARAHGANVVFMDNVPVPAPGEASDALDALFDRVLA